MSYTVSEGGRVDRVTFASGDSYAATEVRSALSLRSTAFAVVKQNKGQITITVLGYGHGVGMSQWGAQMMALGGYSWRQILSHYYTGASLDTLSSRFE
jgi:stage II sporulation protein D